MGILALPTKGIRIFGFAKKNFIDDIFRTFCPQVHLKKKVQYAYIHREASEFRSSHRRRSFTGCDDDDDDDD